MLKTEKKETIHIDFTAMGRTELEEFAMEKTNRVVALEAENDYFRELIRRNQNNKFGSPSERFVFEGQTSLFNEAENDADPGSKEPEKSEALPAPKQGKRKGHKKALTQRLPKEAIEYKLTDDRLACPKCGGELKEIATDVRTEIEVIPAKYKAVEHRSKVYSCKACDKDGIEGTVITAPSPKGMFRNSLASPGLVADIMYKKYALAQPLYRQAAELSRIGVNLGRNTLANWVIQASSRYLMPVRDHMKKALLGGDAIFVDETPVEVLDEPGRDATAQSYMWVYRSGMCEKREIILFDYSPGRGAEHPKAFLGGQYKGYIQCDGYGVYRALAREDGTGPPGIAIVACWAHARRKFTDIIKSLPKNTDIKGTVAAAALGYINALFKIEEEAKDMTPADRQECRQENAKPIVDKYFTWLRSVRDDCTGSLQKAVDYSLNHEEELRVYLTDGRLDISTNLCENALRPFCVGRKNWLFAATPNGAKASATCYSIIETAKANGIDPFEYIKYIFTVFKDSDIGSLDMEDYMPWSPSLPEACRPRETAEACAS